MRFGYQYYGHRFIADVSLLTIFLCPGGTLGKNTGGGWLDSLGSRIFVRKIYFGVFKKKLIWTIVRGQLNMIHMDNLG